MTGTFRKMTSPPYSQQQQQIAGQEQGIASQQQNLGQTLEQPIVTGQLPPGGQATVDLALKNALDTIKGRFASLGLSGSSMEADAVANAQEQSAVNQFSIEQALASLGLSATGQATGALGSADSTFSNLANQQVAQDAALEKAIAGFAGAAVGGRGGSPGVPGAGAGAAAAGEGSDAIGTMLATLGIDIVGA
jgi:hypothetical protein